MGAILEPEAELLWALFRDATLVTRLSRSPGGWRTLSEHELTVLGLTESESQAVLALQQLVSRSFPSLPRNKLATFQDVARVYGHRLGGLVHEVMIAVALNNAHHVIGEVELGSGGMHSAALTVGDVFRPLIRLGARAVILVHNHPNGDPTPSPQDVALTEILILAAEVVDIQIVDHVVIAGRGNGYVSLFEQGALTRPGKPVAHKRSLDARG
jgi:DNA repair protein RadC